MKVIILLVMFFMLVLSISRLVSDTCPSLSGISLHNILNLILEQGFMGTCESEEATEISETDESSKTYKPL